MNQITRHPPVESLTEITYLVGSVKPVFVGRHCGIDLQNKLGEATCDNQNFTHLAVCHVCFLLMIPSLHLYHLEIPTIVIFHVLPTHVSPRKKLKKFTIRIIPRSPFTFSLLRFTPHYSSLLPPQKFFPYFTQIDHVDVSKTSHVTHPRACPLCGHNLFQYRAMFCTKHKFFNFVFIIKNSSSRLFRESIPTSLVHDHVAHT